MSSETRRGVFLQARLGSSRLPHKILLDLAGKTVLEHAMHRLSHVPADVHAVLTDKASFPVISRICARWSDWECFEGPAQDVLARFVFAARHYAVDWIVRATADNPLVSPDLARRLVKLGDAYRGDYHGFTRIPYGAGVEYVSTEALETAFLESMNPYDHEHVCPYLYNNAERFRIHLLEGPEDYRYPDLRITLDTDVDFRFLQSLFRGLPVEEPEGLSMVIKNLYSLAI